MVQLSSSVDVDLLPGPTDPSNFTLPQQPFNQCLFPLASRLSSFHPVPNPYSASIDHLLFVGASGQTIDNINRYMKATDSLQIMENTLRYRHLAPTAPDTLGCYPADEDPFVLDECPHIYFAGNQPQFQTALITGEQGQVVRLIAIPSFLENQTIVLVNLRTKECHPISFSTHHKDN